MTATTSPAIYWTHSAFVGDSGGYQLEGVRSMAFAAKLAYSDPWFAVVLRADGSTRYETPHATAEEAMKAVEAFLKVEATPPVPGVVETDEEAIAAVLSGGPSLLREVPVPTRGGR